LIQDLFLRGLMQDRLALCWKRSWEKCRFK